MRPIPLSPILPTAKPGAPDMMRAPAPILPKPTGSIAGAASAQARAMTGLAAAAPSEPSMHQVTGDTDAPPPDSTSHQLAASGDASAPAPEPTMHQMNAGADTTPPLSQSEPPTAGPATLKTIRLSSNDPPLSVILELSGPVSFNKNLEAETDGSTATVVLKDVHPRRRAADSPRIRQIDFQGLQRFEQFGRHDRHVEHAAGRTFCDRPARSPTAPPDDVHPASRNPENQLREITAAPAESEHRQQ